MRLPTADEFAANLDAALVDGGPLVKNSPKAAVGTSLRGALSADQPGAWASDHRKESEKFTGWNYIAIRAIALQGAGADVCAYQTTAAARPKSKAYQKDDPDTQPLPADHRLSKLLKSPSPSQSAGLFNYERIMQLQLTGSALVYNVPNRAGLTVERYVLPTAICQPVRASKDLPNGGWRVMPTAANKFFEDGFFQLGTLLQVIGKTIPAERVQVTRWPHPVAKDDGQSPVSAGARWADTADMVDQSRWSHLQNGPDPSLIIEAPAGWDGEEADLDRATTKFNSKYAGAKNTGKAIFTTGTNIKPLTTAPKQMAYGEGFIQLRDAIMALHGCSPVAAGITDGGSYAAFYASLLQTRTLTVQPILDMLADDDTRALSKEYGANLVVEMISPSIEDDELLERQLANDLAGGVRMLDEWRSIRGLDPVGGEAGKRFVSAQGALPGVLPTRTPGATGMPGVPQLGTDRVQLDGKPGISSPVEQPKPGIGPEQAGDKSPENIASTNNLNGAQITAAIDVLAGVTGGTVAPLVAIELLVAVGIDKPIAERMVAASAKIKPQPEPEPIPARVNGFNGKHHNGNGHAKRFSFPYP